MHHEVELYKYYHWSVDCKYNWCWVFILDYQH